MDSTDTLFCDFDAPTALIFNAEIPALVHFTHIPVFAVAFLLGFFVLYQGAKKLPNLVFFFTMIVFGTWVFLDSMFWAANRPDYIMMIWTLLVLIEPLVHIGMLYLLYIFVNRKDMPFSWKAVAALIFLPQVFLVTRFLAEFDIAGCLPQETNFSYYSYLSESLFILWITGYVLFSAGRIWRDSHGRETLTIAIGTVLFLISFTGGNIYGSFTGKWELGALGLLGIMLFSAFMAYSIVKFQTFNTKVVGAQMLVITLATLIGSQLAIAQTLAQKVVMTGTFILTGFFGYFLVRSVQREVERKDELLDLTHQLERANQDLKKLDKAKSEFISIASHQLRTPLTAIKGYLSLIAEGSYGPVSPEVKGAMGKVFKSNERIIVLVEDLLSISRIESGRMKYNFVEADLSKIVLELRDTFVNRAQAKSIEFTISVPNEPMLIMADEGKLREVISNVIDNALKYTEKGFVHVNVERDGAVIKTIVNDSGIGIPQEIMPQLFKKFSRGEDPSRLHVDGTGLGLYVGRSIVEAHHGQITLSSEGAGKGSTFVIEVPIHEPEQV